jgi:arylsulfatase A-like enzyme
VRLDGRVVFEHAQPWADRAVAAWHAVALPAGDDRQLEFEVEGSLANTVFLEPLLAPEDAGQRGQRPWPDDRPDIVVFLADTFRADNMTVYGGRHGVTPNLDALAARSACFTRAWSTSPWTLPSHATLFSGYYPVQVHVAGEGRRLPDDVHTIAELLARAGYRTGALTDGGMVSARFGLDQGFTWFSERVRRVREIEEMLDEAQAFLDADDGRPTFLFMHTYRVHWPYRVSAATRAELGERLGIRGEAMALLADAFREAKEQGVPATRLVKDLKGFTRTPRMLALSDELRAHYLGGVADFDRAIGGFLERMAASGFLDTGYLVFTSDHGEGFLEHGNLFHGGRLFEEQTRIPLLIAGRGLAGRTSDDPASLIDLAPTLAEMAGLPKLPDWPGRSLLAPLGNRALLSFESSGESGNSLFVVEELRKVMLLPPGREPAERLLAAYDLAQDGGEQRDHAATDVTWPRELVEKHGAAITRALEPLFQGEEAVLAPEKQDELRALGY